MDEAEDPILSPIFWIAKWVDFQDKYGFGYTLSEGHCGVNFNDSQKFLMNANKVNLMFLDNDLTEHYFDMNVGDWNQNDRTMAKKMKLLKYITDYMEKQLMHSGSKNENLSDNFARGWVV